MERKRRMIASAIQITAVDGEDCMTDFIDLDFIHELCARRVGI